MVSFYIETFGIKCHFIQSLADCFDTTNKIYNIDLKEFKMYFRALQFEKNPTLDSS